MESPCAFQSLMRHFLDPIEKRLDRAAARTHRYWPVIVVLVAVALAFALRTPRYGEMLAFPSTAYGKAITWWLDHPFSTVPIDEFFPPSTLGEGFNAGDASHCDKLAFRSTLPLLS